MEHMVKQPWSKCLFPFLTTPYLTCNLLTSADVHRVNPGGSEPLPVAAHLHPGSHPPVHQQEDRRDASPHLRYSRQLLLQHAEEQQGPVLHHQVLCVLCFNYAGYGHHLQRQLYYCPILLCVCYFFL